jgi:hypothetical protein
MVRVAKGTLLQCNRKAEIQNGIVMNRIGKGLTDVAWMAVGGWPGELCTSIGILHVLTVVIWPASDASHGSIRRPKDATPSKTTITMTAIISPYSIVDCARGRARAHECARIHILPWWRGNSPHMLIGSSFKRTLVPGRGSLGAPDRPASAQAR